MGLFDRLRGKGSAGPASDGPEEDASGELAEELPLRPRFADLDETERSRIAALVGELEGSGLDLSDLGAIERYYDRELAAWLDLPARKRPDHGPIVERIGVAVGEYLVRRTDLEWLWVTDAFGSNPAVGERGDDFVVVPRDLVGVRWLSRRTGWIGDVVGHLQWVREDRAR